MRVVGGLNWIGRSGKWLDLGLFRKRIGFIYRLDIGGEGKRRIKDYF